jgi:hypothetical protein
VSWGLTTTTCATCGATIRAISAALPVTSNATRSVGARLDANNSSASGVVAIRPTDRVLPAFQRDFLLFGRCDLACVWALDWAPGRPLAVIVVGEETHCWRGFTGLVRDEDNTTRARGLADLRSLTPA